jgi:hypothetical protein
MCWGKSQEVKKSICTKHCLKQPAIRIEIELAIQSNKNSKCKNGNFETPVLAN